jgi:hypothetical protein
MFLHTPGQKWYGATDGTAPDKFFAVANPTYGAVPQSELFEIDTTAWTVTSLGFVTAPVGGEPIREIGYDEDTGVLYGTDYANLYRVPTAGGATTLIGSFSPAGTPPASAIDYVFAMDYDSVGNRLLGTSWDRGANQTSLYSFNTTPSPAVGQATLIGPTGVDRTSDIWFPNGPTDLLGTARDGRVLNINTATGNASVGGTADEVNFYGLANAGAGSPPPPAFTTVPLTNLAYETYVFAEVDSFVGLPTGASDTANGNDDDTAVNQFSLVNFDVLAEVPNGVTPWQNTNAEIYMGLSGSPSVPNGMLRFSSDMLATATGSDENLLGVTRHSSVYATASVRGVIGVGIPDGQAAGTPVLFGVGIYDWGDGFDLMTWNLVITNNANPAIVYLDANETTGPTSFAFDVPAGEAIDYDFIFDGLLFEATDGDYDMFVDLDFGAAHQTPEPASMIALSLGAITLLARKRRRVS